MTEAMPFLQKAILLSYDPRPFGGAVFYASKLQIKFSSFRRLPTVVPSGSRNMVIECS